MRPTSVTTRSGPAFATASAIGVLKILLALSVLVPLLLFATIAWINYRAAFSETLRDLDQISEVVREHASRVFDSLNQVADRANDIAGALDPAGAFEQQQQLHEAFAGIIAHLPQVQSVLLAASDGRPIASATVFPVPTNVNVSQRDYFSSVVNGFSGSYISMLQVGDINRQRFFGLSRTWNGPDARPKGVIDVAVAPASFREFYQALLTGSGESARGRIVTLVREDGQILVRYPDFPLDSARAPSGGAFFSAIGRSPDHGSYVGASVIDSAAPERLFVYRKVPGFPLYVVAGESRATVVSGWLRTVAGHLMFGVPATIAIFALAWTALIRTRREEQALQVAKQEIRRREAAEQTLLRAQRLEAVGQMTGGVAHDFNNLLTIIVGNAELLERRADDADRVRRLAANVLVAARRGAELTQKLLIFSRRHLVRPQVVEIDQLLEGMKSVMQRSAGDDHQVEFVLASGPGPVRLDPGQFEAALLNLVQNARDAMPKGGLIRISTRPMTLGRGDRPEMVAGAYVSVTVSDAGVGMDAATLAKAIEPFMTTKDVGQGTGLGLSQVYGFVKQAGGDISIDSFPGRGTTVELLLPRLPERAAVDRPQDDGVPCSESGHGEVVLVVEDEPHLLEMAVEALAELGYATLTAIDAKTALQTIRAGEERIDLMFSDVLMPGGMNGIQLTLEARRMRPNLRVLLTSGFTAPEMGRDLPEDVPLLPKPYDRRELAARLHALLHA